MIYCATHYQGKPAVYDKVARVFYTGFKTMYEARNRADVLNQESNPSHNRNQNPNQESK